MANLGWQSLLEQLPEAPLTPRLSEQFSSPNIILASLLHGSPDITTRQNAQCLCCPQHSDNEIQKFTPPLTIWCMATTAGKTTLSITLHIVSCVLCNGLDPKSNLHTAHFGTVTQGPCLPEHSLFTRVSSIACASLFIFQPQPGPALQCLLAFTWLTHAGAMLLHTCVFSSHTSESL